MFNLSPWILVFQLYIVAKTVFLLKSPAVTPSELQQHENPTVVKRSNSLISHCVSHAVFCIVISNVVLNTSVSYTILNRDDVKMTGEGKSQY